MIRRLVVTAALSIAAASAVHAQGKTQPDAKCTTTSTDPTDQRRLLQDACQKAVDIFNYMAPQLGTAIAGGNATLGQGSTLGGLGDFSFGLRLTAVRGAVPLLDRTSRPDTGAARQSTLRTERKPLPMPAVDLAIGLFKGIPLGVTHLGGVDLLVSATYIPEVGDAEKGDEFTLKAPDGSLKLGYGARLGILQEGKVVPGVSVTYLMRGLPKLDITGTIKDPNNAALSDSVYVRELDITASSWRIVASKKLLFLGLALGYGMDKYDASANIGAVVNEQCPIILVCRASTGAQPLATFDQEVTRSNMFANVSLNLFMFKLAGEVGQVSGGDITTFNRFVDEKNEAEAPDKSRLYISAGLRVGF